LVNGQAAKASYKVRSGDQITGQGAAPEPLALQPECLPLAVLYNDEDLLVVEKPAGMVVHPGAGIRHGTLANALLYLLGSTISNSDSLRPGIVHRLDKGTSGLLVIAKNELSHRMLAQKFKSREVEKIYLSMVYGTPRQVEGRIDAPIGRDPINRTRMSLRSPRPRTALTDYLILEAWGDFSLLQVRIHTGRTHQIRVHLASIGHPVVGDTVYGARRFKITASLAKRSAIEKLNRLFLHAARLSFSHPRTGQSMTFESPLPPELEALRIILS
jgi:23S rRNA pseudouridine1911/1915/1917 synthase